MKIVILGWGSLLWDERDEFDQQHEDWKFDGPNLKLEFSRVSQSRKGILTLVLDYSHGSLCQVAYTFSKRINPDDAICDLRSREGTTINNIGCYSADNSLKRYHEEKAFNDIKNWAKERNTDVVIWTDLKSNFQDKACIPFSIDNALTYLQNLNNEAKAEAAEYIWRAPNFINTDLRQALQTQPWFKV